MAMPKIEACQVNNCFYNQNSMCHAAAITVGSECAACDTFMQSGKHSSLPETGMVGACKVANCRHNRDFFCNAGSIRVDHHSQHADCVTFAQR